MLIELCMFFYTFRIEVVYFSRHLVAYDYITGHRLQPFTGSSCQLN